MQAIVGKKDIKKEGLNHIESIANIVSKKRLILLI
jgi:hypothetical protein